MLLGWIQAKLTRLMRCTNRLLQDLFEGDSAHTPVNYVCALTASLTSTGTKAEGLK